jgi:hypothetical protein
MREKEGEREERMSERKKEKESRRKQIDTLSIHWICYI